MAQTIPIGNDNRKVIAGNNVVLKYKVVDPSNVAINLTGSTIDFGMSRARTLSQFEGSTVVTKSTTTGGITITAPTAGTFQVALLASDTLSLQGVYYYEVKLTDASANVTTLANGTFTIQPNLI